MTPSVKAAARYGAEHVRYNHGRWVAIDSVFDLTRVHPYPFAKQAAWAWLRSRQDEEGNPRFSFQQIARMTHPKYGRAFDHTSIMHGVKTFRAAFPELWAALIEEQLDLFAERAA